ncbi:hypothetical protein M885DRAFT_567978 [Pelagophyceae sp. CCMP2097]|nr:hypothetical protein M885DRAFT_567978 [Pelagophyceae sp. CCMP2097]
MADEDEFAGLPSDEEALASDDDDSGDDDGGSDDDGGTNFLPVLKGTCTITDRRLFWSGKWADSEAAFAEGATKKFKYGGPVDLEQTALDNPPATGIWNGYFMSPGVVLIFEAGPALSDFAVSGHGANDYGDFVLKGTYSVLTRRLDLTKTYGAGAESDNADDADDDEAFDKDAGEDGDYADELAGLQEEQDMPVEELMKRYRAAADDEAPPRNSKKNRDQ